MKILFQEVDENLNTSYVDIKLKWKAYMLLGMNDLNTSYVDIKQ